MVAPALVPSIDVVRAVRVYDCAGLAEGDGDGRGVRPLENAAVLLGELVATRVPHDQLEAADADRLDTLCEVAVLNLVHDFLPRRGLRAVRGVECKVPSKPWA